MVPAVADGVDESGFALLDLFDGAFERAFQIVGVFERAFGIPAHRFRQSGEVGIGIIKIHADMRARWIGAAGSSQNELMVPIVVISAVVEHDDEHRDLVFCRDPERAGIEHEIAVRL